MIKEVRLKGTFESVTLNPETIDLEHLYLNYKCAFCGWTILQVDPVDGPFYSRVVFDKKGREEVQDFCSESCWQEKRMRDK
jgi:hypothetical protein